MAIPSIPPVVVWLIGWVVLGLLAAVFGVVIARFVIGPYITDPLLERAGLIDSTESSEGCD